MPILDLSVDELLTTTRAVRKRLDLTRPVAPEVIQQCLALALQAPTSGWGTILPATWSFMLAARSRGLGTVLTSLHLHFEQEAAEILHIPYDQIMQIGLIPVAYTLGTNFKPAVRKPLETVLHWNQW